MQNFIPWRFRQFIKRLLPAGARLEPQYRGKSNPEIFNHIYAHGAWGRTEDGLSTSGTGSHTAQIIEPYIKAVGDWLAEIQPDTIVDLGCGDFNVGKNFVGRTKNYVACDVSTVILDRNREKFRDLNNVEFRQLDLAQDALPEGDVCFVRQVLQHLSNRDIRRFVEKVNRDRPFQYLVVSEHLPDTDNFRPNRNKPSGGNIRLCLNSGVVLHQKPFYLSARKHSVLLEVNESEGIIRTTVYAF